MVTQTFRSYPFVAPMAASQRLLLAFFTSIFCFQIANAAIRVAKVASPDGRLTITITPGKQLSYSVSLGIDEVVTPSPIALNLGNNLILGPNADLERKKDRAVNTIAKGNFYKRAIVPNIYNESELEFDKGFSLVVRAYNDGVAFRWVTKQKGRIKIYNEVFDLNLPQNCRLYAAYKPSKDLFDGFENVYDTLPVTKLDTAKVVMTPLLADLGKAKVFVSESDLFDYPGLNLKRQSADRATISGRFAPVVTAIKGVADGKKADYDLFKPTKSADYIAETDGDRHFPWRVFIVTDNDAALASSDLIYLLARPSMIEDQSWIKPGKAVWEWWNNWSMTGVDFKAGINTQTYKYYIDFAAAHKLEYVVLDEGWSKSLATMLDVVPEINMKELADYAKAKNVGLILWGTGYALDKETTEVFERYSKLGIKGFKIDFLNRDDQYMVNFFERMLKEAAKYKMLLDYHGAFKPTGLNRTWPNEINREGVYGNEQNKWSSALTPYQQVLFPFIRYVQGHGDFTPGGMRSANQGQFKPVFTMPMVQGTRVHQLAEYLIYDGALQMLCESPTEYLKEKQVLDYLSDVPTTFDDTKVVAAELGKYIVVAKRKGERWYLAGMSSEEYTATIETSFLTRRGPHDVVLYQDGVNSDRNANDYTVSKTTTDKKSSLKIKLAKGGGVVAIID